MSTSRSTGASSSSPSAGCEPVLARLLGIEPQHRAGRARELEQRVDRGARLRRAPVREQRRGADGRVHGSTSRRRRARAVAVERRRPRRASASQTNVSRLPFGPGRPGARVAEHRRAEPAAAARPTAISAPRRSGGSRTTPPLPTRSRPTSNCGLTSARQSNRGAAHASTGGSTFASEMNDTSITIRSGAYGQLGRAQRAGVAPLDHGHPRIVAQPPVELAVGDVDRDHVRRAPLQQAVGETARRRADVERVTRRRRRRPSASSALASLIAAARDEARGAAATSISTSSGDELAGLLGAAALGQQQHVAGEHRRRRAAARLEQAALGQQLVEPHPANFRSRPVRDRPHTQIRRLAPRLTHDENRAGVSLPAHGTVELIAGMAALAAPVVFGFGAAGIVVSVVLGGDADGRRHDAPGSARLGGRVAREPRRRARDPDRASARSGSRSPANVAPPRSSPCWSRSRHCSASRRGTSPRADERRTDFLPAIKRRYISPPWNGPLTGGPFHFRNDVTLRSRHQILTVRLGGRPVDGRRHTRAEQEQRYCERASGV